MKSRERERERERGREWESEKEKMSDREGLRDPICKSEKREKSKRGPDIDRINMTKG